MATSTTPDQSTFDRGAAVTRSLLGWGVVAGPFYLVVGLAQALTRDGFELSEHALSLLMLGDLGWIQTSNLVLTGLMVLAAAVGFARVMPRRGVAIALAVYGAGMLASAAFAPDPVAGFPPGSVVPETVSTSGLVHLAGGAIGFVALAVAAWLAATWFLEEGAADTARVSRIAAGTIVVTFVGGAALAQSTIGVVGLWVAVVAGFAWLLIASRRAYGLAPHPHGHDAGR